MNSMELRRPGMPKVKAFVEASMPAVLSFGPLFIVIGLQGPRETHNGLSLVDNVCALAGALALSLGLLFLWRRQTGILRRLDELERIRD